MNLSGKKGFACLDHGLSKNHSGIIHRFVRNFKNDLVMHRSNRPGSGIGRSLGKLLYEFSRRFPFLWMALSCCHEQAHMSQAVFAHYDRWKSKGFPGKALQIFDEAGRATDVSPPHVFRFQPGLCVNMPETCLFQPVTLNFFWYRHSTEVFWAKTPPEEAVGMVGTGVGAHCSGLQQTTNNRSGHETLNCCDRRLYDAFVCSRFCSSFHPRH